MHRPYKTPIVKAFPDIKISDHGISKFVISFCRPLGKLYLRFFIGVTRIVLQGEPHLFDAFRRALAGESRCIIAFRHPNGAEPQVLSWFFLYRLKSLAAKSGVKFARRPHAVFVYGYEVARWGGAFIRYIMSNLGAMPIHHYKMDSEGLDRICKAIADGPYPVAMAPEGQVSYTSDAVPRLEPGLVRIGFFAAQRLEAKNINCPVEILPVSVHFRYGSMSSAERLLRRVEKLTQGQQMTGKNPEQKEKPSFTERLERCRNHILEINETRYQIVGDASLSFEERLEKVINAALETAERMIGVKSEGEFFFRIYRLRQYCWDRIFLPGVDTLEGMSRIERSTIDLQAGEVWYIARHQELVDFCWYFWVPLPAEDTAFHNKVEYVQNLWDFANRTMGGAYSDRVSIFARKVIIQAAPVINLSERLPEYQKDRKNAVTRAMGDLEKSFNDCISEVDKLGLG